MPTSVNTVRHLNQSPHANLPAGILSWGCNNWLLIQKRLSAFPSLSGVVGPLHSQCPHYLCFLLLVNSLLSEMLCVWKFFSNLHSDCLDKNHMDKLGFLNFRTCKCLLPLSTELSFLFFFFFLFLRRRLFNKYHTVSGLQNGFLI